MWMPDGAPEGIIDFLDQGRSVEGLEPKAAASEQTTEVHSQQAARVAEILDLDVVKRFGGGPDLADQSFDKQSGALEGWLEGIQKNSRDNKPQQHIRDM